jgi:hypothetical protein
MSYDEEQQRKSRVVIETPTARREEVYTSTSRSPEREGFSTAAVAIVALVAIAATALILFFWMNSGTDATNANVTVATAPATPIPTAPTPIYLPQQQPVQQPAGHYPTACGDAARSRHHRATRANFRRTALCPCGS